MTKVQSGRSMVEMLGVLAIIGVLSIGGIAGYTMAMNRHKANQIADFATRLAIAGQTYAGTGVTNAMSAAELGLDVPAGNLVTNASNVSGSNGVYTVTLTYGDGASNNIQNAVKTVTGAGPASIQFNEVGIVPGSGTTAANNS